jgi:hypothetical protein
MGQTFRDGLTDEMSCVEKLRTAPVSAAQELVEERVCSWLRDTSLQVQAGQGLSKVVLACPRETDASY